MKQDLLRLISESRDMLPYATPGQKLRLLKLIKESLKKLSEQSKPKRIQLSENSDYLEEK